MDGLSRAILRYVFGYIVSRALRCHHRLRVHVCPQEYGHNRNVSINVFGVALHAQTPEVPPPLVLDKRGLVWRDAWLLETLATII